MKDGMHEGRVYITTVSATDAMRTSKDDNCVPGPERLNGRSV